MSKPGDSRRNRGVWRDSEPLNRPLVPTVPIRSRFTRGRSLVRSQPRPFRPRITSRFRSTMRCEGCDRCEKARGGAPLGAPRLGSWRPCRMGVPSPDPIPPRSGVRRGRESRASKRIQGGGLPGLAASEKPGKLDVTPAVRVRDHLGAGRDGRVPRRRRAVEVVGNTSRFGGLAPLKIRSGLRTSANRSRPPFTTRVDASSRHGPNVLRARPQELIAE